MRLSRSLILLALLLTACSTPSQPPAAEEVPPAVIPPAKDLIPATVAVSYRFGDTWKPVTPQNSHVPPGPAELRITFSKPVNQAEVEQALAEAQPAPVRGALQWADGRTLNWRIAQLPPRVNFLFGEAHDQEGVSLSGGISPLRVGEAPALVEVNPNGGETRLSTLPPDIVHASLTPDRKFLNMQVWTPGATRWDWQTTNINMPVGGSEYRAGRIEGFQLRLPANLESWAVSPAGNLVAGLRAGTQPGQRDLVISDTLGGRQQVIPGFVSRSAGAGTAGAVWSADGARVAALTDAGQGRSAVAVVEIAERKVSTLTPEISVPGGTARLAWSTDGRFLLAGPFLVDLQSGAQLRLPGEAASASGAWEPESTRLLYGAGDWDQILLVDAATGKSEPLGTGLVVGWGAPGKAYVIRWGAAATRYVPPGQ